MALYRENKRKKTSRLEWRNHFGIWLLTLITIAVIGRSAPNGNNSFATGAAADLINGQSIPAGLGSIGFGAGVGGVAFGAVAEPSRNDLELVSIAYDSTAPEGTRLIATVLDAGSQQDFVVVAPDWQIVPIARYAHSGQHAAMTLFGFMVDPEDDIWMESNGYEVINFEPSFKNTLLGLRIFQADILILSTASADLPRTSEGYLLGWGESAPDVQANEASLTALHSVLEPFGSPPFQSYIITDQGEGVFFDIDPALGELVLTGTPYWYCWRQPEMSDSQYTAIWVDAEYQANVQLNAEMQADWNVMTYEAFWAKYTDDYQQQRFDEIFDALISPHIMEALPGVSAAISDQLAMTGGVNPAVYDALSQTMRLAALFRRAAMIDMDQFAHFIASLETVDVEPCITTPAGYVFGSPLILPDESLQCPNAETGTDTHVMSDTEFVTPSDTGGDLPTGTSVDLPTDTSIDLPTDTSSPLEPETWTDSDSAQSNTSETVDTATAVEDVVPPPGQHMTTDSMVEDTADVAATGGNEETSSLVDDAPVEMMTDTQNADTGTTAPRAPSKPIDMIETSTDTDYGALTETETSGKKKGCDCSTPGHYDNQNQGVALLFFLLVSLFFVLRKGDSND